MLNDFHSSSNYYRQMITVNNEQMSYIQLGNLNAEKSIVIIHGSSFNANVMIPYGDIYAQNGYNVILVDLPGHFVGNSPSKNQFNQLGDSIANLMKELIAQNKLSNKSDVHGWSLGGSVALDMGIRYSELVKSVGMLDCASNYNGADLGSVTEDNKIATITGLVTALKSSAVSQDVTNKIIAELPSTQAPAEATNNDFAIDKVLNIDDRLGEINVPVYDFYAGNDSLTPLDKQNEMMSKIKEGRLYIADGYNHFAVVENPTLVYNAIKSIEYVEQLE